MPYDELTKKHLNKLANTIRETLAVKNINDTGSVSESLEVQGNTLFANDYIYFLDEGRAPGRFPPVNKIREWVMNKLGISYEDSNSVAYLVGRKIATQGTEIYQNRAKGLQLRELIDNMLDELMEELPDEMAAEALKLI